MVSAILVAKASERKSARGNILGSSVSAMLGYVMGKKFFVSKKFMPAGLLTILSAAGFLYNLIEAKVLVSWKGDDENTSTPSDEDHSKDSTDATSTTE